MITIPIDLMCDKCIYLSGDRDDLGEEFVWCAKGHQDFPTKEEGCPDYQYEGDNYGDEED